jgi:signal transduction histidine kinase
MPYALICIPLILLIANCLRGAYCDVRMIRAAALKSEMSRLDSESVFQVGRVETLLDVHGAADAPWSELRTQPWMRTFWTNLLAKDSQRMYVAITDPSGRIELHSNPEREGQRLRPDWYDHRVPEAGADVVYAAASPLSGDEPAYHLRVPIRIGERWIGDYHVGQSAKWLNENVADLERHALIGWAWTLALAIVANVGAVYGLMGLASQRQELARRMRDAVHTRTRELAQLGSGLAHEMRNPLHALRMNLHTLKRALGQGNNLSREQIAETVEESDAVIDRLDVLLGDLVQLTSPAQGERAALDVANEVQATLNLLAEDMRRSQIDVRRKWPDKPVHVSAEPACFRQILLNILTFAQHGAGKNGVVEVQVQSQNGQAEVVVANSGLTLSDDQRATLFDPFQSPVETGSGLGLALVQSLLGNLGGTASGERRANGGTVLRIRLPLAKAANSGVNS